MRVEGFWKISATLRPSSARLESGSSASCCARSSSASSSSRLSSAPVRRWRVMEAASVGAPRRRTCTNRGAMWDRARMRLQPLPRAVARSAPQRCSAGALLAGCGSSGDDDERPADDAPGQLPHPADQHLRQQPEGDRRPQFATPSKSDPVQSGSAQIAYRNVTARPDTLRVKAGTTVRFVNYDPIEHNATSVGGPQQFPSKNFGEGGELRSEAHAPRDRALRVHDPPRDDQRDDRSLV